MPETVKMLKALSDENRFKIFNILRDGETCACELLEDFDISQPTLSRHMKILVDSGLVKARKDAQWVRYSINPEALKQLQAYFDSFKPDEISLIKPPCDCRN
jgi:ArsR family transcriptional regulator